MAYTGTPEVQTTTITTVTIKYTDDDGNEVASLTLHENGTAEVIVNSEGSFVASASNLPLYTQMIEDAQKYNDQQAATQGEEANG